MNACILEMLYFDRIDVSEGKEFDSNKRIKISIFVIIYKYIKIGKDIYEGSNNLFFFQNVLFVLPYKEPIFAENTCLFFFILNNTQGIFEGVLNSFFINGKLHVLILSDFLSKRVILFSFLTMKCFDFS